MSKKKTLSEEDKRRLALLTPCKTKLEMKNWIKFHLGLHLPDVTVSRYADTNPLDMIWEVYSICVLKQNPENVQELLFVAGRGSGKTLGMAIAELMVILHDKRDTVHVGAILSQAKRCYEYQIKFLLNDKIKPVIDPPKQAVDKKILQKANMEKSLFLIDGEQVSLEVLPCTLKACNGPHVPLVVVDEIDTVSGEGLKAFKEISGMLDSKGGKKALRVGISTRKSRYGLMNQQIENAEKEGRHVRRWTAFEFTERCPDEKSGLDPTDVYILQDTMETLSVEDYNKKDAKKQKEYVKYTMPGKGCQTCPIAPICLGDAKNQNSKSPMLKPIDELIKKVRSEGADWALAQLMNLKPSVEGIIYKEFEEKVHVKDWNQMWFILTGKEFPGECTHDLFVKKCHEMRLTCYGGIDWGWSNPNTVVYFFVDKKDNVYVVRAEGMTYVSQPSWVHHIKTRWHQMYRCQLYFPDVADQGAIEEMKKAGLPAANDVDKAINTGIQAIKKMLRVPGQTEPKMFIAKETCGPLITEFSMYHFKTDAAGIITDVPEEEYDHWLDALRYGITMLFGKSTMIIGGGVNVVDNTSIIDKNGNYHRVPTAAEYAAANNMNFNPDVDTSKIGKVGTKSKLDDDGDDGVGGEGGFLWSF
jgi:hypothetical protein